MPPLNKGDLAIINEMVHEVVNERQERFVETCPWGQMIERQKAYARGLVFGVGIPTLVVAVVVLADMVSRWAGG